MTTLNIGFTGTRQGMSNPQFDEVLRIVEMLKKTAPRTGLYQIADISAFHGDAVGADSQFDSICTSFGIVRFIYPSNIEGQRAHCEDRGARIAAPPAPPLERNVVIVQHSHIMIAAPHIGDEHFAGDVRSGTWSTIRKARRASRPLFLVNPNGTCQWPNLDKLRRELAR